MCKKCKNGLDLEELGLKTFDLKSKAMSVNTQLDISLDIRQNEELDENGHFFYGDGAYIEACFHNPGGIGLGINSEYLISKPVKITHCPFCGEKITKKDF